MNISLKKGERRTPWRRPEISSKWTPWLFLLPSLLATGIFLFLPFVDVFRRSFFSAMGGKFMGLSNYVTVLNNPAFQQAAYNTARFTLICIPILLALSLVLALLLNAAGGRSGLIKTSFLLPMAIPAASVALLWKVAFSDQGVLNYFLTALGKPPVPWMASEWTFWLLIGSYLWKNTGYDMVLWLSGLSGISKDLYEAAGVDGAGPWKKLIYITLPELKPTFYTTAILSLLNSFKVFREAYLIGGDYPDTSIYLLQHLFNNWFLNLDIDKMCSAAAMMASVVLLAIQIFRRVLREDSI